MQGLDKVGRVAAVATVITYATGLLAINSYLYELGVSDFELLRPRFVLTGALLFLTVGIATLGLLTSVAGLRWVFTKGTTQERLLGAALIVFGLAGPVSIFLTLFSRNHWATLQFYFWSLCLGGILITFMWGAGSLFPEQPGAADLEYRGEANGALRTARTGGRPGAGPETEVHRAWFSWLKWQEVRWALMLLGAMLFLFLGFRCVNEFTNVVLPYVPEQLGGTKPREVQLVLTSEGADELERLGLAFHSSETNEGVTEHIRLLFEGSEFFVVQPRCPYYSENPTVFTIRSDRVIAVHLERDIPGVTQKLGRCPGSRE